MGFWVFWGFGVLGFWVFRVSPVLSGKLLSWIWPKNRNSRLSFLSGKPSQQAPTRFKFLESKYWGLGFWVFWVFRVSPVLSGKLLSWIRPENRNSRLSFLSGKPSQQAPTRFKFLKSKYWGLGFWVFWVFRVSPVLSRKLLSAPRQKSNYEQICFIIASRLLARRANLLGVLGFWGFGVLGV